MIRCAKKGVRIFLNIVVTMISHNMLLPYPKCDPVFSFVRDTPPFGKRNSPQWQCHGLILSTTQKSITNIIVLLVLET
jgi:hypothetical protein